MTTMPYARAQDTRDAEVAAAWQDLESVYRRVSSRLTVEQRRELDSAQRAWAQMRDADCRWAYIDRRDCVLERTMARTRQLSETPFHHSNGRYGTPAP